MTLADKKFMRRVGLAIGIAMMLSACGGTKSSGLFSGVTTCTGVGCPTSDGTPSLRMTNDTSSLIKKSDNQVQIGGVCNPGEHGYNEIRLKIKRLQQSCAAALSETSIGTTGYCENGRFYNIITLNAAARATIGSGCPVDSNIQFTVISQIYYGTSPSNLTAGPKYTSDITVQF